MAPKPGVPDGGGHSPGQSAAVEPCHDPQSQVNEEKEENLTGDSPPESRVKSGEERAEGRRRRTSGALENGSSHRRTSTSSDASGGEVCRPLHAACQLPYRCAICPSETFSSQDDLARHLEGTHGDGAVPVDKPSLKRPRSLSPKMELPSLAVAWDYHNALSQQPVTCPECNVSVNMWWYTAHCVSVHGGVMEPQPRPPAAHRAHLQLGSAGKQLNCEKCPFQTRDPGEMDHHTIIHRFRELSARLGSGSSDSETGRHRPHSLSGDSSAPQPEGNTAGQSSLGEEASHGEDTEDPAAGRIRAMKAKGEFPCGLCDEVFPNLRAMKGHNRVHMQSAPYRCNVCIYTSGDKSSLTRHMKEHNGQRPYECRVCKFAFTTKANCERHLKNRHQLKLRQELADNMKVSPYGETGSAPMNVSAVQPPHRLRNVLPASQLPSLPTALTYCSLCDLECTDFVQASQHVRLRHPTRNPRDILQPAVQLKSSNDSLAARRGAMNPSQNNSPAFSSEPPVFSLQNMVTSVKQAPPKMPLTSSVVPFVATSSESARQSSSLTEDARRLLHAQLLLELDGAEPLDLRSQRQSSHSGPPPAKCQRLSPPEELLQTAPLGSEALVSGLTLAHRLLMAKMSLFNMGMMSAYCLDRNITAGVSSDPAGGLLSDSGGGIMSHQQGLHSLRLAMLQAENIQGRGDVSLAEKIRPHQASGESTSATNNNHDTASPNKLKQARYRLHKPYACSYCETRFTLNSNVDRHVKNHHPDKWEKKQRRPRSRPDTGHRQGLSQPSNHDNDEASTAPERTEASEERQGADSENCSIKPDKDLAIASSLINSAQTETVKQCFQSSSLERMELETSPVGPESSLRSDQTNSCDHQSSDDASRPVSSGESDSGTERRRSAYSSAPHKIPCRFCRREFPWNSSLRRHELTHSGEKPYSCPHCCILFTTKSNCDRHMSRKHGVTSSSGGEACRPLPAASQLLNRCALCPSETFSSQDDLARHLEGTHGGGGGSSPVARLQFWCHVCEEMFHRLETARQHVEMEHQAVWADLQLRNNWVPEITGEDQPSERLLCLVCVRGFDCAEELRQHVNDDHLVKA